MQVNYQNHTATLFEILKPILTGIESLIKNYLSSDITYYNTYMPLKLISLLRMINAV